MGLPAFANEDESGITEFEDYPDQSSTPLYVPDEVRYERRVTSRTGQILSVHVVAVKFQWTLNFPDVSGAFIDTLNTFYALRRCLFLRDSGNTDDKFPVRFLEVAPRFQALGNGRYRVSIGMEQL